MIEIPSHDGCPFCDYLCGIEKCAFVSKGYAVSSFLNRTQFERGATLIVPNAHFETLLDMDTELIAQIYTEAQRIAAGMVKAFDAVGVNVFQNNGVHAGQSVPHFHVHVVPRYPSSNPLKLFQESDFQPTPLIELEAIASELQCALPPN